MSNNLYGVWSESRGIWWHHSGRVFNTDNYGLSEAQRIDANYWTQDAYVKDWVVMEFTEHVPVYYAPISYNDRMIGQLHRTIGSKMWLDSLTQDQRQVLRERIAPVLVEFLASVQESESPPILPVTIPDWYFHVGYDGLALGDDVTITHCGVALDCRVVKIDSDGTAILHSVPREVSNE